MEQRCSTEVTLFFNAISPHIDVCHTLARVWKFRRSVRRRLLLSRPFSNSSSCFFLTVQSMNFLVLLRRPKQNSGHYRSFQQNDCNKFVSDVHRVKLPCPTEESNLGTNYSLEHPQWLQPRSEPVTFVIRNRRVTHSTESSDIINSVMGLFKNFITYVWISAYLFTYRLLCFWRVLRPSDLFPPCC